METIKNYIDLTGKFQLLSKSYAYVDFLDPSTGKYLADGIFIKNGLKVKFGKGELKNIGTDYVIILCDIKKKDNDKFLECMKELHNKILLLGHNRYDGICEDIWKRILAFTSNSTNN